MPECAQMRAVPVAKRAEAHLRTGSAAIGFLQLAGPRGDPGDGGGLHRDGVENVTGYSEFSRGRM